jgi:hypothetical protein
MSKKKLLTVLTLMLISACAFAQPQISGAQSGTLGPGDYIVVGDIRVVSGAVLTIAPNTRFLHTGAYKWEISGQLNINGAEGDSVIFTRQQPIDQHKWRGIRFLAGSSAQSSVNYAVIEWCNYPSGTTYYGLGMYINVGISVTNSRISNCSSYWDGAGIYVNGCTAIIDHCVITDNSSNSGSNGGGIVLNNAGSSQITNCIIARNAATGT